MTRNDRDVLVVAADPEFRALGKHLLSRIGCAIREARTGEEALRLAEDLRPGLVVLDVLLPDVTGYAVCQELRELFGEDVSIIFVSQERTEPADRVAGLLLGADDYVVRPFDPDEFVARARRGLARARRSPDADTSPPPGLSDLTDRERVVLRSLAEGHDQAAIADELFISPTTVSTHIQRILSKLGVHSRAQAVAVAHLEKLVELPLSAVDGRANLGPLGQTGSDGTKPVPIARYLPDGKPDRHPGKAVVLETLRSSTRAVQRITRAPGRTGSLAPEPAPDLKVLGYDAAGAAAPPSDQELRGERNGSRELESTPWWLDAATARACVSAVTGELTDISNEWAGLMRRHPEELIGRHFMDFVLPEARADASSFFDVVRRVGEVRSRAHVRRGDGSMIEIEFRAVAEGDSIEVAYRPLSADEPVTEVASHTSETLVRAGTEE
jgi:DNA-binding NarL/FixJ family response regulator